MENKVIIEMPVAVHPLKAAIWKGIKSGKIKVGFSLREIAKIVGEPTLSPQKIKHHLETMVTMGTIGKKNGMYDY